MSKVAVVTGGASGIGQAISQRLAKCGNKVAVFDSQGEALKAQVTALQNNGLQAIAFKVDVTDRPAVDSAIASVRDEFGPIQILVTSAGVTAFEPFTDITLNSGTGRWRSI